MTTLRNRAIADLNWRDYGGSGDTMVLVHGLGGSLSSWDAVGPRLAQKRRVVAVDLPGFGLSPPRHDYRLETHTGALVQFIEALETPVILVGNSMGGLVCELLASQRADLLSRLVLVAPATPVRLTDPDIDLLTALRLGVEATPIVGAAALRAVTRNMTPEEVVDLSLRLITHDSARIPPEVVHNLVETVRDRRAMSWPETALNRSASSIARLYRKPRDFVRMIRDIETPTLVVQGESDPIVSPNAVRWMVSLRSDWTHIEMEDTGHTPQLDAPVRFCGVIEDWLAATVGSTAPEPTTS